MSKGNGLARGRSKVNSRGRRGQGHGVVATQLRVKQRRGSDKLNLNGHYGRQMAVAASVTIVEDGPCYSVKLDRIKSKRKIIMKVKTVCIAALLVVLFS